MSGNNNEWRKFGGVSKLNSFNVINTGTLIADQFVSRSSRPTSQTFAGTLEVTVDVEAGNNITAGNNIHIGNSITAFADIFINQNAYINHKIFFFSTDPTSDASLVDLSSVLVSDTSHAFIAGDISNIGINIVDPKTIFHISCDVSNVTDILTVESSNGLIRSIMSQTKDKKGIVFDASNETSNIAFFNGGEDISTNKLNTPTAFIRHVSGGFLSINTSNTIDVSSATFFVDTSGVNLKLDGSGVVLESSGSIIIDTSSSFQLDSSRGFFLMDASTGAINMGASGELRILTSVSDDNIGSIFVLNKEQAMLSTSGGVLINSSGGIIELNATNKGEVVFNSGSFNLNTTLNFAPPDVDISTNKLYDETITIYDNSLQEFFPNIYNHDPSGIFTGSGLTIRTQDPSNNTTMRLVSAKSGKGAQITGGVYPDKNDDKNMAMFGLTDLSNNFTPNHMILSGSERHNKLTTLGINTYKPLVDEYVLDINGPIHINNTEINTVVKSNFEYQTMSFSRINSLYGIASGSPSSIIDTQYTQILLHTSDGGKNWIQSNIYEKETGEGLEEEDEDTNRIDYKESFLFDLNYGIIGGQDNRIYYTKNGGIDWKKLEFSDRSNANITALGGTITNIDSVDVYRFFTVFDDGGNSLIRTIDISASVIAAKLAFDFASTHKVSDTEGETFLSRTLDSTGRIESITSVDINGRYLYLAGTTGIDRIDTNTDIINFPILGNYPRTMSSAGVSLGITSLNYKDICVYDDTNVIAVGDNLISVTTDGLTWTDGSLNLINNIGDVSLNKCFIVDKNNALIVGDRGTILHSNNWSDVNSWTRIPDKLISQAGTENLLLDPCCNLISIAMPENGNYLIENNIEQFRLETTDLPGTPGFSRMEYFTAPGMFHNSINNVLDVSGNIAVTGAINAESITAVSMQIAAVDDAISGFIEGSNDKTGYLFKAPSTVTSSDQNVLKIDSSNSILHPGINTALMILKASEDTTDGDFIMRSANLDLSNVLIRDPNFELPHGQYTEDVMQRITSGILIEGDLSCNNRLFIEKDVQISGRLAVQQYKSENIIHTTTSTYSFLSINEDMSLNGRLFVSDKIAIKPAGTGTMDSEPEVSLDLSGCTDAIHIPAGTTGERPNVQKDGSNHADYKGYIRYNTDLDTFEGFGAGPAWGSLGGVIDVDQDTFIKAEVTAGFDEDQLRFFTASGDEFTTPAPQLRMIIDGSGMAIGGTFSTDISNNRLTTPPTGVHAPPDGLVVQGRVGIGSMRPAVSLDLSMCKDAVHLPRGTTGERPNVQINGIDHESYKGYIRYNTEQDTFEGFGAGNSWGSLGGVIDVDQDTKIIAETTAGADNDQLQFFTDGSLNMTIDKSGFVGIGNTSPSALLDISGMLIHRGPRSESLTAPLSLNSFRPIIIGSPITNYKHGYDNTFIGMDSLTNFQYGNSFTIVGHDTFQNYIGDTDVDYPVDENGNQTGEVHTYGSANSMSNTAIGDTAGKDLIYGGYNTFLGANTQISGFVTNTITNQIMNSTAIGFGATIDSSNQIVLGGTTGLESTYPDVFMYANAYILNNITKDMIQDTEWIDHPSGVVPVFIAGTSTTVSNTNENIPVAQFINGTATVTEINKKGIFHKRGTAYFSIYSSSNNLYLHSYASSGQNDPSIYFRISGADKAIINSSGQIEATSFNATSDARLKENIIPLKDPLQKINQLQGVHFNWIEDASNNLNTGFIAQDVEKVIPEIVATAQEKSQKGIHTKSINYSAVVPYLVESVKTLSNEVENLKNENEALKEKMKQYDLWFAQLLNK
tara:strand:+ start:2024 stop:7390 length:5367 start_codon:yes stop_codon:yes gene_type:complete